MLFQIKGRFDGLVKCEVEITATHNASESTNLGKAVLAAVSKHADLSGADLRSANLRGADLSGADLRSADLSGADLRSADLSGADLGGADLSGADLRSANLRSANLRSANLSGADLSGADLRSANLSGADLGGADLSGADLGGAVAKVSKLVGITQRSDGYTFLGFVKESDGSLGIVAGCQNRTLASYRHHVAKEYLARGSSAALIAETTDILDFLEKRHAAMMKA